MPSRLRHIAPHACGLVFLGVCAIAIAAVVRVTSLPTDFLYRHLVVDDALYYVQPALNAVDGKGYSFDGVYRTNGVQPLWAGLALCMTALLRTPDSIVRAMVLVGGLLWVAGAALVFRLLAPAGKCGALLGAVIVLTAGLDQRLALWGMEAGLHCFLLPLTLLSARDVARRQPGSPASRTAMWRFGIVAALLSLSRVEYGLLAALLGVWLVYWHRSLGGGLTALRATWPYLVPLATIGASWLLFSRIYFGEWTPVSGSVKAWVCRNDPRPLGDRMAEMSFLALARTFPSPFIGLFSWLSLLLGRLATQKEVLWSLIAVLAPLLLGGAALWRRRHEHLAWRLLGPAVVLAVFVLVHIFLLAKILVLFAGYCGWYMTGEIVALGAACGFLANSLRGWWRAAAFPATALVVVMATLATPSWFDRVETWVTSPFVSLGRFAERWLPRGVTIGCFASGYIAIENPDNRVVNLDGLINDGRFLRDYIMQDRVADYFRDERIGYFADGLTAGNWRVHLDQETSMLPKTRQLIHCWPEPGDTVVGLVATGLGDPALPVSPPHPLGAVHFAAFVHAEHRVVSEATREQLPAGQVIVSSCVVGGRTVQHVAVAVERLAEVVDPAGLLALPACNRRFGESISLRAIEVPTEPVMPGTSFAVTTYWQALEGLRGGPSLRLRLSIGSLTLEELPAHGTLPLQGWPVGVVLPHTFVVSLPTTMTAGEHRLHIDVRGERNQSLGVDPGEDPPSFVVVIGER